MSNNTIDGKIIVITGGTGSFGKQFIQYTLQHYKPKRLIVVSRDELKQKQLRKKYPEESTPVRFIIGDVRHKEAMFNATKGADIVIHAAALKQVPLCEENPTEAIKTNVIGTMNVITAAIENNVERMMLISTDKATNPANLYGSTKLAAEKLTISMPNAKQNDGDFKVIKTKCSVCRYGNVVGSRGSVVPLFREQAKSGKVTITDERMTRFWITLEQAVAFVHLSLSKMQGGEIFIPKIPSMKIMQMVEALAPGAQVVITGIRPGEKLHEAMISREEAPYASEYEHNFVIRPLTPNTVDTFGGKACAHDFYYASDINPDFLSVPQLIEILKNVH